MSEFDALTGRLAGFEAEHARLVAARDRLAHDAVARVPGASADLARVQVELDELDMRIARTHEQIVALPARGGGPAMTASAMPGLTRK